MILDRDSRREKLTFSYIRQVIEKGNGHVVILEGKRYPLILGGDSRQGKFTFCYLRRRFEKRERDIL